MWQVIYSRTFLRELAKLPEGVRSRVEEVVFGEAIKQDPRLGGRVEKMVGYRDYYKMRFGNYRVGLRIDGQQKVIEFRRVLHRKDIYRKFP